MFYFFIIALIKILEAIFKLYNIYKYKIVDNKKESYIFNLILLLLWLFNLYNKVLIVIKFDVILYSLILYVFLYILIISNSAKNPFSSGRGPLFLMSATPTKPSDPANAKTDSKPVSETRSG